MKKSQVLLTAVELSGSPNKVCTTNVKTVASVGMRVGMEELTLWT